MMKQWNKPEMKVFSVRMNENIAASGGESGGAVGDGYEKVGIVCFRSDQAGGIVEKKANFNCKGTVIADTGISYLVVSGYPYVYRSSWTSIAGCQV